MGYRTPKNNVKSGIDWIFTERVKQTDLQDTANSMDAIEAVDGERFVYRKVNRRDKSKLIEIAKNRLSKYLQEHPDNTLKLFVEVETARAKEYQTYFPNYKTDRTDKSYYFDLEHWIEALKSLPIHGQPETKPDNLKVPQIALNHFYEGIQITRENADGIAAEHGYKESRTKKVIFETLTNIDKQGWQYAFVFEQDYILFTDLLTSFFECKPYTLPETIIQLKRTCKTKLAKALGEIHKELSNENKLSTDTKYFQLIRVLSHFEKETEGDLYKALTR